MSPTHGPSTRLLGCNHLRRLLVGRSKIKTNLDLSSLFSFEIKQIAKEREEGGERGEGRGKESFEVTLEY